MLALDGLFGSSRLTRIGNDAGPCCKTWGWFKEFKPENTHMTMPKPPVNAALYNLSRTPHTNMDLNSTFPRAATKYLSLSWSSVPGNGWTTKCIDVMGSIQNHTQMCEICGNCSSSITVCMWIHRNRLMAKNLEFRSQPPHPHAAILTLPSFFSVCWLVHMQPLRWLDPEHKQEMC